jgi:hypothetical protein
MRAAVAMMIVPVVVPRPAVGVMVVAIALVVIVLPRPMIVIMMTMVVADVVIFVVRARTTRRPRRGY